MRGRFTMRQRLAILREQEVTRVSDGELCRRYNIQHTQLNRWKLSLTQIRMAGGRRLSLQQGRRPEFWELEDELLRYVHDRRERRAIVTVRNLTDELFRLVPLERQRSFVCMRRYTYRFMARNRLSIRRITRNVSLSDLELQRRGEFFLSEVRSIQETWSRTLYVNMDQTAVFHDMAPRTTVELVGAPNVAASSHKTSDRVTVALTACSNGDKLNPLIIFKGSEHGRIIRQLNSRTSQLPQRAVYAVQASAWMDRRIMSEWLRLVLFPYTDGIRQDWQQIVLVLDSLRVHHTDDVVRMVEEKGIRLLRIPGGLTGQYQPIDVGINAPFKHWLREAATNDPIPQHEVPEQRRTRLARRVVTCWQMLDTQLVINSFNHMLVGIADEIDDFDEIE